MLKSQQQEKKQNGLKLAGPLLHMGMDLRWLLTLGQRAGGEAGRLGLEQNLGLDAMQHKRPKAKRPRARDDGSTGTGAARALVHLAWTKQHGRERCGDLAQGGPAAGTRGGSGEV